MNRNRVWEEIGRTEAITNTLNPDWATKICMYYNFEEQQRLQFEMYVLFFSYYNYKAKNE